MDRRRCRGQERNVGAFLGPDILIAAPTRTLSDEYRDVPAEPEDDHVPESEPPSVLSRLGAWLAHRPQAGPPGE